MVIASRVNSFQTIYSVVFIKIDLVENCYLLIDFNIMYLCFIHTLQFYRSIVLEIKSKNVVNLNI